MINLKTAKYQEAYDYIAEHMTNGELVHKGVTFKLDAKKKPSDNDSIRMHIDGLEFVWGGWYYTYSDSTKSEAIYCMTGIHMKDVKKFEQASHLIAGLFGIDLDNGTDIDLKEDSVIVDERDMTIAKLEAQLEVYKRFAPTPDTVTYTKAKES